MRTSYKTKPAEYSVWHGIRARCYYPSSKGYASYGGRGIEMCKQWRMNFYDFLKDMGPRPSPEHQIERIDNNGNYSPENCRWATAKEQSNNKRSNRFVTARGETRTISQWSELTGIKKSTIRKRLEDGLSDEESILPVQFESVNVGEESITITEIARRLRTSYQAILGRIDRGVKGDDLLEPIKKGATFTHNGETHTIREWAKISGIARHVLTCRLIKSEWDVERALTTPTRPMKPSDEWKKFP